MKFGEMVKILQRKEEGYIVLINSGKFYVERGKDAILLNKELDLKLVCMEKQVCKVGFPKELLEKYMKILKRKRYAYIVYNFDRNLNKLEIIAKYEGKIKSDIEFKFIINSNNKSIIEFEIQLLNKSIVQIQAYNEMADYCYKESNKNNMIFIYGKLNQAGKIIIEEVKKVYINKNLKYK